MSEIAVREAGEVESTGRARLFKALSLAQAEIKGARKDAENPHLKSKYADLASIWEACREALTKHGLTIIQLPSAVGPVVTVETILGHESGEFISEKLALTAQQHTPQGIGSAITYGRRYGLAAMVGVAPEDDDGEGAMNRKELAQDVAREKIKKMKAQEPPPMPPLTVEYSDAPARKDDMVPVLEASVVAAQPDLPEGKFPALDAFGDYKLMFESLAGNDEPYRAILRQFGYEKSNEIKKRAEAERIYKLMGAAICKLKALAPPSDDVA